MSMTSIVNSIWEHPMIHVWYKLGDSSLKFKSVTSYRADKVYGRTDAGNDNIPSAWKAKGKNCAPGCDQCFCFEI